MTNKTPITSEMEHLYRIWAKANVAETLWIHDGAENSKIFDLRMVVLADYGKTAIVARLEGNKGWIVVGVQKLTKANGQNG